MELTTMNNTDSSNTGGGYGPQAHDALHDHPHASSGSAAASHSSSSSSGSSGILSSKNSVLGAVGSVGHSIQDTGSAVAIGAGAIAKKILPSGSKASWSSSSSSAPATTSAFSAMPTSTVNDGTVDHHQQHHRHNPLVSGMKNRIHSVARETRHFASTIGHETNKLLPGSGRRAYEEGSASNDPCGNYAHLDSKHLGSSDREGSDDSDRYVGMASSPSSHSGPPISTGDTRRQAAVDGGNNCAPNSSSYQDPILVKMEPMFKIYFEGVSVKEWVETCWLDLHKDVVSDQGDPPHAATSSFFGSFLQSSGNHDVDVRPWNTLFTGGDDGQDANSVVDPEQYVNDWDQENYTHVRAVSFYKPPGSFSKQPVAVQQIQRLRCTDDVAIISIEVHTSKIPFEDAFEVQMRWVVQQRQSLSRSPSGCLLQVEVGCFVVFHKKVMVAGAIRSNTYSSTKDTQRNLVDLMIGVCDGRLVDPNSIDTDKTRSAASNSITMTFTDSGGQQSGGRSSGTFHVDTKNARINHQQHLQSTNPLALCFNSICGFFYQSCVSCCVSFGSTVLSGILKSPSVQESATELMTFIARDHFDNPGRRRAVVDDMVIHVHDVWYKHQHDIEQETKRNDPLRLFEHFKSQTREHTPNPARWVKSKFRTSDESVSTPATGGSETGDDRNYNDHSRLV